MPETGDLSVAQIFRETMTVTRHQELCWVKGTNAIISPHHVRVAEVLRQDVWPNFTYRALVWVMCQETTGGAGRA